MESIEILANGIYLPKKEITNEMLELKYKTKKEDIYNKTGIENRYYVENEAIEDLAINAVRNLLDKIDFNKNKIDMIVVASTSTNKLMPGISYLIQKELEIQECICLDILAGCSGYINAFDIARNYITLNKAKYALIIGCEVLSKYTNFEDKNTRIIFSDGAGATLIKRSNTYKEYTSLIQSNGSKGDILTCMQNEKIYMDGKAIYKYAITDTVKNVKQLLSQTKYTLEDIKYIIPHQSNIRIIQAIAARLDININKMYTNLKQVGNTFCASIPIALNEMYEKGLLKSKDKIILLGYGGGLNLGSILLEV